MVCCRHFKVSKVVFAVDVFNMSFGLIILAFFGLETVLVAFGIIGHFFKSFGHPVL